MRLVHVAPLVVVAIALGTGCEKKLPTATHGTIVPSNTATGGAGGSGGAGGTGATTGTGATIGTGSTGTGGAGAGTATGSTGTGTIGGQGGMGSGGAGHGGAGGQGGAGGSACLRCNDLYEAAGDPTKLCPDSLPLYEALQGCACADEADCNVACSDQLCANAGVPFQADCWSCLLGGCKVPNANCQADQ